IRRISGTPARQTFALYPLVFSAGKDKIYDIVTERTGTPIHYANPPSTGTPGDLNLLNDPFLVIPKTSGGDYDKQLGTPLDGNGDGELNYFDNITNHDVGAV
ncbi:MAG: hypothetical protein ACC645_26385, partial [Pirellulales bacterium]